MPKDPSLDTAYSLQTPDDNRRLYRDWAETYDSDFAEKSGYRMARLIARAYLDAGGQWPALDVGCGTGLLAQSLPPDAVIDGVDISPEMLAVAARKDRYRHLIELNLMEPFTLAHAPYAGMTSSGTFTHGHVGPVALGRLIDFLAPGAVAAISGRTGHFEDTGFAALLDRLAAMEVISNPTYREELVYEPGATPAPGHENDRGYVITFRKL